MGSARRSLTVSHARAGQFQLPEPFGMELSPVLVAASADARKIRNLSLHNRPAHGSCGELHGVTGYTAASSDQRIESNENLWIV